MNTRPSSIIARPIRRFLFDLEHAGRPARGFIREFPAQASLMISSAISKLTQFATLSPMPGMAAWVRKHPQVLAESGVDMPLDELSAGTWAADKRLVRKLNDPLSRLGARYLATAKQGWRERTASRPGVALPSWQRGASRATQLSW
jgi:hypothetical protein